VDIHLKQTHGISEQMDIDGWGSITLYYFVDILYYFLTGEPATCLSHRRLSTLYSTTHFTAIVGNSVRVT